MFHIFSFCFIFSFFFISFVESFHDPSDPLFDHQNTTYTSHITPFNLSDVNIAITPYFSPDHSAQVEVQLIEGACESIDIEIPNLKSWIGCSEASGTGSCIGCSPADVRYKEQFPIFQALLDAVYRGVKVRILTNDYSNVCCKDKIDPITFLYLAGAEVKFFNRVTFLHNKYISADKKQAAISSINYSFTSFMKNREAGVLFEDFEGDGILSFLNAVFEEDYYAGNDIQVQEYSKEAMEIIRNKTSIPIIIPIPKYFHCAIASPFNTLRAYGADIKFFVSPDFAYDMFIEGLSEATSNLTLYMYQITSPELTKKLIEMFKNGIRLNILVSCAVFGGDDRQAAFEQYQQLLDAGIRIRMTDMDCLSYAHQKFWVVDKEKIWLSSGNWSPSDVPSGQNVFPPYGAKTWMDVNRDFHVKMEGGSVKSELVRAFTDVYYEDYRQGFDYTGSKDFLERKECGKRR